MKRIVLLITVIILSINITIGQDVEIKSSKSTGLGFGFNVGAPLGKTSSLIEFLIGADLQFSYNLGTKLDITASAGFDVWHGKKAKNINYAPILGGLRFYVSDNIYISEQAGYAVGVSKDETTEDNIEGAFTNVAGIGLKIGKTSDLLLCHKGLFYSGATRNVIALRFGYNFGK